MAGAGRMMIRPYDRRRGLARLVGVAKGGSVKHSLAMVQKTGHLSFVDGQWSCFGSVPLRGAAVVPLIRCLNESAPYGIPVDVPYGLDQRLDLLDGLEDARNRMVVAPGIYDQVYVIRHEGIRLHIKHMGGPSGVDGLSEESAEAGLQQELTLPIATERQRMRLARQVPAPTTFAVSLTIPHAVKPIAKLRLTLPPSHTEIVSHGSWLSILRDYRSWESGAM